MELFRIPSSFTSYGPSYDGRVKPEICATGTASALVNTSGTPSYGNGTSFATPIMAGMMACLLQKYKSQSQNPSVTTILQSVFKTGSLFSNPTAQMGYGIPDFKVAEQNLTTFDSVQQLNKNSFLLSENKDFKTLTIRFVTENLAHQASVRIYSVIGNLIFSQPITDTSTVIRTSNFASGIYAVCVTENGKTETRKIILN